MDNNDKTFILDRLEHFQIENKGTFTKALVGSLTFRRMDDILRTKKKENDGFIYSLLDDENVDIPKNLYKDLNQIWRKSSLNIYIKQYLNNQNGGETPIIFAGMQGIMRTPTALISTLGIHLAAYQYGIQHKWKEYQKNSYDYVKKYLDSLK